MELNTIKLGNCYELIKEIPDKSIDLVYIDIPYLFESGGNGYCRGPYVCTRVSTRIFGGCHLILCNELTGRIVLPIRQRITVQV